MGLLASAFRSRSRSRFLCPIDSSSQLLPWHRSQARTQNCNRTSTCDRGHTTEDTRPRAADLHSYGHLPSASHILKHTS